MLPIDYPEKLLSSLRNMALQGGREAMRHYRNIGVVRRKKDQSPVTEADIAVDGLLISALQAEFPTIRTVSEERVNSQIAGNPAEPFFLIDPIDGTKEFIRETGEFTINIALINNGIAVAGVVYAPAIGRMFSGARGLGACEDSINEACTSFEGQISISIKACDQAKIIAIVSKSHMTDETVQFLQHNRISDCRNGGSSLKFCLLAAGEADIYPRFGPTMEWDTAAGHAVLSAAGGKVVGLSGAELAYGKPEFRNPHFIAASPTVPYCLPDQLV